MQHAVVVPHHKPSVALAVRTDIPSAGSIQERIRKNLRDVPTGRVGERRDINHQPKPYQRAYSGQASNSS
jgi:hypothetical protein